MRRSVWLKPVNGWKPFASEVAIVVLGVLLALGAQQIVESVQQNQKRDASREAIRSELSENLDQVRRRQENQLCVDKRLAEIQELILATPKNGKLPRPLWIGRPQVWGINQERFQVAISDAGTSLLPKGEQANYVRLYGVLEAFEQQQDPEQAAWARLRSLSFLPTLDDQARANMIAALMEARYANFRIKVAIGQTYDIADELNLKRTHSPYREGSRSVCIPINTPRDKAMRQATRGREEYGEP